VYIPKSIGCLVDDPRHFFKVGDKVKVKIIDIKDGKVCSRSNSLKKSVQVAATKYNKGDKVEGVVIKFKTSMARSPLSRGYRGLVHISELAARKNYPDLGARPIAPLPSRSRS